MPGSSNCKLIVFLTSMLLFSFFLTGFITLLGENTLQAREHPQNSRDAIPGNELEALSDSFKLAEENNENQGEEGENREDGEDGVEGENDNSSDDEEDELESDHYEHEEDMHPGVEEEENYYRGEVISLEHLEESPELTFQKAEVLITSGPFEGHEIIIDNRYEPDDPYTFKLEEGMEVILVHVDEGEFLEGIYLHDISRDRGIYLLLGLMALFLVILGGKKGFRALITLSFTIFFILQILLPLILQGYSPIMVSVVSAIILIILILLIIAGINRKSMVAILGTICGVITAGLLAYWAGDIAHLTGFSSEEAQMLFYLEKDLDIRGLLFAGIIIGALGAVADVGISVASAAEEIRQVDPDIKTPDLIKGCMNVGRDVMATMSNTIILAYVGAATPLLLLILGMETPWLDIINTDLIATEIVRSVTVTFGFIVTVPVTAVLAGYFLNKK